MRAVVAENLTKIYASGKQALEDVCFSIDEGEIFGFLGPNGAGKTTAVKLLNGMLTPSAGTGQVFGLDSSRGAGKSAHAVRRCHRARADV